MERFRESKNQNLLRQQPWLGQGFGGSVNLCIPEPGHYLAPPKIKSSISLWLLIKNACN